MASVRPTSSGVGPVTEVIRASCASSASGDFADTGHGTTAGAASGSATGTGSSASGACSMMVCALVPLIPKDDTAARRGRPVSGQAVVSVSRRTSPSVQSTCVDGRSMCRDLGRTPCRSAMTVLMTPATPAAAWAWPMFDLMEPSKSGRSSGRS